MSRARSRLVFLIASLLLVGVACSKGSATPSVGEVDAGVDAASEAGFFDPRGYPNTCTTKSDCTLAPIITNCSTCCGSAAVRTDAVSADLEAAREACREMGRGPRNCLMACGEEHAECVGGVCVACTELTCDDGVSVELLPVLEAGTWVIEATVDGAPASCTIETSGASGGSTQTCQGAELKYLPTGPGPASARMAMLIRTTTAKVVSVRMTRDGVELAAKTFEPAYSAVPGPNGPDCEPKQCTVAEVTLR
jgi:hypothetical protein